MVFKFREFLDSAKRVVLLSKKPTWQEYQTMAKVTGLGIILIAIVGFVIIFIFKLTGLGQ